MKIRTDFVTNSSSSSYCTLTVTLKNGKTVDWFGEDGETPIFTVPANAKKMLSEVKNIDELISFIKKCVANADDEYASEVFSERCEKFNVALANLSGIDEISKFSLSWGEYSLDEGLPPEVGCEGESLDYEFETKKFKGSKYPDNEFVQEMIDTYSSECDEDDFYDEFGDCLGGGSNSNEGNRILGNTFVVSGELYDFSSLEELRRIIAEKGGKLMDSISSQDDYVITNDPFSETDILKTARKKGNAIIDEDTFTEDFLDRKKK